MGIPTDSHSHGNPEGLSQEFPKSGRGGAKVNLGPSNDFGLGGLMKSGDAESNSGQILWIPPQEPP